MRGEIDYISKNEIIVSAYFRVSSIPAPQFGALLIYDITSCRNWGALQTKANSPFCSGVRRKLNVVRAGRMIAERERKEKNIARSNLTSAPPSRGNACDNNFNSLRAFKHHNTHSQQKRLTTTPSMYIYENERRARSAAINYIPEAPSAINLGGEQ